MSGFSSLSTGLLSGLFLLIALGLSAPAQATTSTDGAAKASKKVTKKASNKKGASKKVVPPDEEAPDVRDALQTDFNCDSGKQIAIFSKGNGSPYIGLRWKEKLLRLTRVETTTGADRFESLKHGLVWIGIPAKGMLFDSKKGQQLANECRSAEQVRMSSEAAHAAAVAPGAPASPVTPAAPTAPATSPAPTTVPAPVQ